MNTSKLDFFAEIPADEYHRASRDGMYLSSHLLGDFRKSPRLYHMKMTGETVQPETTALLLGRAVHSLVLEGRGAFEREFLAAQGPVNPRTKEPFGKLTKAYKEWAAAQTKSIVSSQDFSLMVRLRQSVWTHPVAMELLGDGIPEMTVRCVYAGEPCQIRMDWFRSDYMGKPVICDLKTCESIDWFEGDARRYGYPQQLAFYRGVLDAASREYDLRDLKADCYLIAVEKREPYRCGVWKLTDAILDACTAENERAIEELRGCRKADRWPTGLEELRILDI